MRIKIHGGVIGSVGPLGLCGSCKNAHIIEMKNTTRIFCQEMVNSIEITSPVLRCREHEDINHPTKWEFEQIAWTVSTDEKTKKVGFKPPQKDN